MTCHTNGCDPAGCRCSCNNCCCKTSTEGKVMAPFVGEKAPDFQCEATMEDGTTHRVVLSSYKGKNAVVLFFYPHDFTFVCPSEIIAFHKAMGEFKSRNVVVLGCSTDSNFVHNAWRNTEPKNGGIGKIDFPLLGDVSHKVSKSYGVLKPEGMALRGLFLIDEHGILRHSLVNDLPIGRSTEEALRVVDALKFHQEHGDVCPANWKKGSKGMKATTAGVAEYLKNNA